MNNEELTNLMYRILKHKWKANEQMCRSTGGFKYWIAIEQDFWDFL